MSVEYPFGTNTLITYAYEPFSFTISNPAPGTYTLSTTKSSQLPAAYLASDGTSSVVFAASSNGMNVGTQSFVISALDASLAVVRTSSNLVSIGPGRFIDATTESSFAGSNYTFYANTPITPIVLSAPFTLSPPTASPSLPPGLSFSTVSGNLVSIVGTPLTTVPQSNYLIIGKEVGSSKTVSATIPFVVNSERVVSSVVPSDLINGLAVGAPIVPVNISTLANGSVQYTWSTLPDGFYVEDNFGNVVTSGFIPIDVGKRIIITGAPTLTAANAFKNAGISSLTQTFLVRRFSPSPVLSNPVPITFQFGETVLFEPVSVPPLYVGSAITSGAVSFRAATYFSNVSVGMSNIFSPNLRSDLSLSFIPSLFPRADLIGTPTSAGTGSYTIRAVNSNGTFRDTTATIAVSNDTVTIAPILDTCYNFVISRPIDLSLNGYYPTPITFSASSASGRSIVWSVPALSNVGLSLSANSGPTTTILGTPNATASLQTLAVQASVTGTSISSTSNLQFAVLNDAITLSSLTSAQLTMIQNRAITPIQLTATSLSGRPVVSFSATGLPTGVSISTTGVISGTPTANGTFASTITGTTGFASSSTPITFTVLEDNIIVVMANTTETVPTVFSGVEFRALTYSGIEGVLTTALSNQAPYQGSNFSTSFVGGTSLQGDFSTVPVLLPEYRFSIRGTVGNYSAEVPVNVITNNAPTIARNIIGLDSLSGIVLPGPPFTSPATPPLGEVKIRRSTTTPYTFDGPVGLGYTPSGLTWTTTQTVSNVPWGIHDLAQNGSVVVATIGSNILRSTDAGATWSNIPSSNIQAIDVSGGPPVIAPPAPDYYPSRPLFGCVANDGTSNWLAIAIGTGVGGTSTSNNILRTSSDNGETWTDTSTNLFINVNRSTKLFYNNGRYFVIAGSNATNPILYASASNLSSWTAPVTSAGDIYNDMAFSNTTALVVGSNGSSSACYSSTNNGANWSALPSSPISYSGAATINTATYAHGLWAVSGRNPAGFSSVSYSSNLTTWTETSAGPGDLQVACEDGGAWQFVGPIVSAIGVWQLAGLPTVYSGLAGGYGFSTKRLVTRPVSNGTPTLTLSIPYDPSDIAFVSPTQTSYINWQFVPIAPITVQTTPSEFKYYYASGLPDGLTFTNDPLGLSATISGTSVAYSDAAQRVLLYVARGSNVAATSLTMRTILPTVTKIQSGASGVTSLLRQYTEVNAAVTARDSRALPAMEYRLGEFTSPEPPSVITATADKCDC